MSTSKDVASFEELIDEVNGDLNGKNDEVVYEIKTNGTGAYYIDDFSPFSQDEVIFKPNALLKLTKLGDSFYNDGIKWCPKINMEFQGYASELLPRKIPIPPVSEWQGYRPQSLSVEDLTRIGFKPMTRSKL